MRDGPNADRRGFSTARRSGPQEVWTQVETPVDAEPGSDLITVLNRIERILTVQTNLLARLTAQAERGSDPFPAEEGDALIASCMN